MKKVQERQRKGQPKAVKKRGGHRQLQLVQQPHPGELCKTEDKADGTEQPQPDSQQQPEADEPQTQSESRVRAPPAARLSPQLGSLPSAQ